MHVSDNDVGHTSQMPISNAHIPHIFNNPSNHFADLWRLLEEWRAQPIVIPLIIAQRGVHEAITIFQGGALFKLTMTASKEEIVEFFNKDILAEEDTSEEDTAIFVKVAYVETS